MNAFTINTDTDGIATLSIDVKHESLNVLNQAVMIEFNQLVDRIEADPTILAIIIVSTKIDCFIAGADISMLQATSTAQEGTAIVQGAHLLLQKIAHSKKPYIAAINGICLGAGYELSLACDYRLATSNSKTKIGLPEVMLGLLPGATGTSKLSRLISLPSALDIMLSGKQLNAKRALHLGMIDEVVPNSILLQAAKQAAYKMITHRYKRKPTPLLQKIMALPLISDAIIYQAKQQVLKKTKGLYPAPLAIIDVVKYGLHKPLTKALAYEAQQFGRLSVSPEAKQLIHIYFATTELKKASFIQTDTAAKKITQVGILGGGLMGAGIATVSIDKANVAVRIKDINDKGLLSVYQHIQQYYKTRIQRKILSQEQAKKKMNQLTSTVNYQGLESCDLIIEAVFEDLAVKHQMLHDIEAITDEHTIFASNTSSIPITEIAKKAQRPENVIGMHYFSPVEKMPLLEIIRHSATSNQTIASAVAFGKQQGKTVIVVNDGAGFYVNRILTPYINAALQLGLEGVAFDKIDQALLNFGFPVGPIKLLDEVGIDIGSKILPILETAFGQRMQSCGMQQHLLDKGRLGKKVKKGFYLYGHTKNKGIDETVYTDLNITLRIDMDEKKIVERCLYPMLNEAIACLEDDIIQSPRDGDIGAIFGIGFPPFLGGPFRYIESLGLSNVLTTLNQLDTDYETHHPASGLLLTMAKKEALFYSMAELESLSSAH